MGRFTVLPDGSCSRRAGRSGVVEDEPELLRRCYISSLAVAAKHQLESVAFPPISTGAYGYPKLQAATVAIAAVRDGLTRPTSVRLVRFVCFSSDDLEIYRRLLTTT